MLWHSDRHDVVPKMGSCVQLDLLFDILQQPSRHVFLHFISLDFLRRPRIQNQHTVRSHVGAIQSNLSILLLAHSRTWLKHHFDPIQSDPQENPQGPQSFSFLEQNTLISLFLSNTDSPCLLTAPSATIWSCDSAGKGDLRPHSHVITILVHCNCHGFMTVMVFHGHMIAICDLHSKFLKWESWQKVIGHSHMMLYLMTMGDSLKDCSQNWHYKTLW